LFSFNDESWTLLLVPLFWISDVSTELFESSSDCAEARVGDSALNKITAIKNTRNAIAILGLIANMMMPPML
jgi:hypothetical protein